MKAAGVEWCAGKVSDTSSSDVQYIMAKYGIFHI